MQLQSRTQVSKYLAKGKEQRRLLWKIWLFSIPVALFGFLGGIAEYLIGYFPSMIVHEIGHMTAGWLTGTPAISFFFASLYYPSLQSAGLLLVCILLEIALFAYCSYRALYAISLGTACIILGHLYFLFFPGAAEFFITFGGMAGELVLPVLVTLVFFDVPTLLGSRLLLLLPICTLSFWFALFEWLLAIFGMAPFPYPPDSAGGAALFQNPFETGVPKGDLDKLLAIHGWSESELTITYTSIALLMFLIIGLLYLLDSNGAEEARSEE